MKFFHISHTDLDGYGCQLLTKEFFNDGFFLNANYGIEVKQSIKIVLDEISKFQNENILFIISDLNLTLQESKELDDEISKLNSIGFKIELQLLDHHITGQKCSDVYDWYFLDVSRCATKIVYDYLCKRFENDDIEEFKKYKTLVDSINAVDIWLENDTQNFEFGKVLMRLVSSATEINTLLFNNENRDYRINLIKNSVHFLDKENGNILLDDAVHSLKKQYLKVCAKAQKDDTIDNLNSLALVQHLDNKKEELTIFYKEHKGLLTYTLGHISIPANCFLKENEDYDFFVDISKKGTASFRASGRLDVSQLAQKLANGGGHINAAGARFEDFKESFKYNDVKMFIQKKLERI